MLNSYSDDKNVRTCSIIRAAYFFLNLLMKRRLSNFQVIDKANHTDRAIEITGKASKAKVCFAAEL